MSHVIEVIRACGGNNLEDAFINVHDPNFQDWPEKPTGVAATSDRANAYRLDAAARDLPEVVLYEHIDFGGAQWRTNLSYSWVGSWWNDRISSIVVVRGTWRFYQHKDFQGSYWDLRPGYYRWVVAVGIPNDIISSFLNIA